MVWQENELLKRNFTRKWTFLTSFDRKMNSERGLTRKWTLKQSLTRKWTFLTRKWTLRTKFDKKKNSWNELWQEMNSSKKVWQENEFSKKFLEINELLKQIWVENVSKTAETKLLCMQPSINVVFNSNFSLNLTKNEWNPKPLQPAFNLKTLKTKKDLLL